MQIRRRPPNPPVNVSSLRYQVAYPNAEPQHILEEIVWHKEKEVDQFRENLSLQELQRLVAAMPAPRDFLGALQTAPTQPAVIAEVKKASPSKGVIREDFDPVAIAQSYEHGGAACISVLTDQRFFQGSFSYLEQVRAAVTRPLLCKDFLIYPYQIYLARKHGADAILLIAAILSDKDLQYFAKIAQALGMAALVEVHSEQELTRVLAMPELKLLGINNRNLQDFSVDLQTTCQLLQKYGEQLRQKNVLVVSESGLHTSEDLQVVNRSGANAVLIGESLMRQADPGLAIAQLFQA